MLETPHLGQQRARWSSIENLSKDQLLTKPSVPSLLNEPRCTPPPLCVVKSAPEDSLWVISQAIPDSLSSPREGFHASPGIKHPTPSTPFPQRMPFTPNKLGHLSPPEIPPSPAA